MIATGIVAIRCTGCLAFALLGCGKIGFDAMPDAAVEVDAAPDAAPIPLCDQFPTALYCSDFEGGDRAGAGRSGGGVTVPIPGGGWQGSDAYSVTAAPGQMPVIQFDIAAVTTGELHVGGRLFLAAGPTSANFVVVAQALSPAFEKISFDLTTADRTQLVNTVVPSAGITGAPGSFPRDRWLCFEMVITIAPAGAGGSATLLIDSVQALSAFANDETAPAGGFTRVEIGALSSGMNTATETVVFDNWIISTNDIGCP